MMMMRKRNAIVIPEELIILVLKELDVKSLLRFRCVCKQWLTIIDDPVFVASHRERSYSRPGGVFFVIEIPCLLRAFLFNPLRPCSTTINRDETYFIRYYLICSEGLLLSSDRLWNLSTRRRVYYPPPPLIYNKEAGEVVVCKQRYFLGFDSLSKEYKLVSLHFVRKRSTYQNLEIIPGYEYGVANILTLGDSSWTTSVDDVNNAANSNHAIWNNDAFPFSCCCINGILYIYQPNVEIRNYYYCNENSVIALELGSQKFRLVPFPDSVEGKCQIRDDFKGNLVLFASSGKFKIECGRWKHKEEEEESSGNDDLLNRFPQQLKPLLEGRSFISCQTVETLFGTKGFEPDGMGDNSLPKIVVEAKNKRRKRRFKRLASLEVGTIKQGKRKA